MTTVREIVEKIDQYAPRYLAEKWDPIGLSFGSYQQVVKKIFVTLDLDHHTLQEVIDIGADLVITHHPFIFEPITTLNAEDSKRQMYIKLIQQNIAVFSAHTNIDRTNDGMNEWLANALNLSNLEVLLPDTENPAYGYGKIGHFEAPMTIDEIIQQIKASFHVDNVRYNERQLGKRYEKVAILGGSGASFASDVLAKGIDLYITGDISYHDAQDMLRDDLSFIDAGHFIENIFVEKMTDRLSKWSNERQWAVEVIASKNQKDVFKFK